MGKIKKGVIFIVGDGKNVGKTTFLNHLLSLLRPQKVGLLSIGIDGEGQDNLTGELKPRISCQKGDIFVTRSNSLKKYDLGAKIIDVLSKKTALGKVVMMQALRKGNIEIIGAQNNLELKKIIEKMKKLVDIVLVDGAINRVTQVATLKDSKIIYVCQISNIDVKSKIEKLKFLNYITKFPLSDTRDGFFINGSLTVSKLKFIPQKSKKLIIEDFSKIFLTYSQIIALRQKVEIQVKNRLSIQSFVINMKNISLDEISRLLDSDLREKVIFNPFLVERRVS